MTLTKVHNRMISGSSVNVKDRGAVGDGVTDDTTAIQGCISYIASQGGGEIYFPAGTYKITGVTVSNDSIQFQGAGPDVSIILMEGPASTEAIYVKNTGTFKTFSIRDMQIRGSENSYDCYGIGTLLQLGGVFENLKFKFLNVCITGADTYNVNYDTITFEEYNRGIRGYTAGDKTARGIAPQGGIADSSFSNVSFYDGNTNGAVGGSIGIEDIGFNSNTIKNSTFYGNYLTPMNLTNSFGYNTFIHCRVERCATGLTWIALGSYNKFIDLGLFSDNVRWSFPNFCIEIVGEANSIDGVSPEYPTNIIKLGPLSNDNEVKWIPAASDSWYSFPYTYFSNPVLDFGSKNLVHIGNSDHIYNKVDAWTDQRVTNHAVETVNQTCFSLDGVVKTDRSTEIAAGPFSVGHVYAYDTPTGNRRFSASIPSVDLTYYCFSAWVASDDVAGLGEFEIIAGDNVSQSTAYATIPQLPSDNTWYRVFKIVRASTNTGVVGGFRLPSSISSGNGLYVSCPQFVECGTNDPNIFVGGYVPTYNAERAVYSPNYGKNIGLSSIPNGGRHYLGEFVENINPVESGTSGSKYIVSGWKRITNGTGNVLNTDWVEVRSLTGN